MLELILAQGPGGVADIGSVIAGYGFGGVLAWLLISGKLKSGTDYDKMLEERNEAIRQQIATLREVIPLVVKSNELVSQMAQHVGGVRDEAVQDDER